jgi:CRP-like cAMP-binding protein
MFYPKNLHYKNELLRRLSQDDLALLEPHLERVSLRLRMTLESSRSPIDFVYFIEEGIASVVGKIPKGRDTGVGLIGFEGMTATAVILGDDRATHDCFIQVAGEAFRAPVEAFTAALSQSPAMRVFMMRYAHALHIQTGFTALVNARSKLQERLARCLLMCDDRVAGEKLAITHEQLSIMLGVRRPGVTVAVEILEGKGVIRANRGEIIMRDREALMALADGSYGEAESEYKRLIGEVHHADREPEAKTSR